MAKKLRKLLIDRVDLVPAGANPDAHIVLFKSATPPPVTKQGEDGDAPLTTNQILARNQLWQQWGPLWDAFCTAVWSIMGCGESAEVHVPALMQSVDEFAGKAREILAGLGLTEKAAPLFTWFDESKSDVTKAGRVLSGRRMAQLKEAMLTLQGILDDALKSSGPKPTPAAKGDTMPTLEDVTKKLEAAEARIKELETDLRLAKMTPEEQEAEYLKGMPDAYRKEREKDKTELANLKKGLEVEKEKRERVEYIEKAAAYRNVGMTPDDDWETLKAIDTLPEKPRERVLQLLKAAGEQLKQSALFVPLGKDARGTEGVSAEERAEGLAKGLMEKDSTLKYADALSQVWKAHPALHEEYQQQARAKGRL